MKEKKIKKLVRKNVIKSATFLYLIMLSIDFKLRLRVPVAQLTRASTARRWAQKCAESRKSG